MTGLKAIDLFCGAGGASVGLAKAGIEVVGAVDADEDAVKTYKRNLCDKELDDFDGAVSFDEPLRADLSRGLIDDVDDDLEPVDFYDICNHFDIEPDEVDIICGCPPCQNYSSLRDTEPWPEYKPKDTLLRTFVEYIKEGKPDVVLFENVRGILSAGQEEPTDYIDWFLRQMRSISWSWESDEAGGYGVDLRVVNAANYGVPQRRHRTIGLFVYGADDEKVSIPDPTHAENPDPESDLKEWRSVSDAIERDNLKQDLDLGQKQIGIEGYPDDPAHRARRHHDSTVEMIKAIRKHGDSWKDLRDTEDDDLIKECHQDLETSAGAAYGIMDGSKPAPTLTTRCANVSSGRFTHPEENRAITFREAALLMTFPEDFELPDKNGAAERVVGNAVPPVLIESIMKRANLGPESEIKQRSVSAQ
jgi:DNA (cytosine-5)-methyltransferase 1